MGDRRLREVEPLADLTARELARGRDCLDHSKPPGVSQGLQEPYELQIVHTLRLHHLGGDVCVRRQGAEA